MGKITNKGENDVNYHTPVLQVSMSEAEKEALLILSKTYLDYPLQICKNGYGYKAYAHIKEKNKSMFGLGREFGKYLLKPK